MPLFPTRAVLCGLVVLSLAACAAPPAAAPSATPSPAAASSPAGVGSSAKAAAAELMLVEADVPGWTLLTKTPDDWFAQWVCGVWVDPETSDGAFAGTYMKADKSAILYQTTRPAGVAGAQKVLDDLSDSLKTCRKDLRQRGSLQVHYDITPLTLSGADVVAFRQQEEGADNWLDWAVFRIDGTLVGIEIASKSPKADLAELNALVSAVRAKA
jgi:hypothetical protein